MNDEETCIISSQPLVNDFIQITIPSLKALPGQFVYSQAKILYVMGEGEGTELLLPPDFSSDLCNRTFRISALQGEALTAPIKTQFTLLIAQDNALAALIFYLKKYRTTFHGLVILGATTHFPFAPCPSRQIIQGIPVGVIGALPLLEDWGIPHRLACLEEMPGVFHGSAEDLAQQWLATLPKTYSSSILTKILIS